MILTQPRALKYLPDISQLKPTLLDRDWFFNIINTLDPHFFPSAIKQIDETKLNKNNQKSKDDTVIIDKEMLELLEGLVDSMHSKRKARSSLQRLSHTTKKRKPSVLNREEIVFKKQLKI